MDYAYSEYSYSNKKAAEQDRQLFRKKPLMCSNQSEDEHKEVFSSDEDNDNSSVVKSYVPIEFNRSLLQSSADMSTSFHDQIKVAPKWFEREHQQLLTDRNKTA